ncbi:MAG: transposase, partial [Bryobacter sp.]|nr:transposase [Bryobacter sp. CoA8 C33]
MSATFHTTLLQSFMGSVVFPVMNELFRHNRRMMKAYLLKESLDRLWTYTYEGAARRYLNRWIDQLKWQ